MTSQEKQDATSSETATATRSDQQHTLLQHLLYAIQDASLWLAPVQHYVKEESRMLCQHVHSACYMETSVVPPASHTTKSSLQEESKRENRSHCSKIRNHIQPNIWGHPLSAKYNSAKRWGIEWLPGQMNLSRSLKESARSGSDLWITGMLVWQDFPRVRCVWDNVSTLTQGRSEVKGQLWEMSLTTAKRLLCQYIHVWYQIFILLTANMHKAAVIILLSIWHYLCYLGSYFTEIYMWFIAVQETDLHFHKFVSAAINSECCQVPSTKTEDVYCIKTNISVLI